MAQLNVDPAVWVPLVVVGGALLLAMLAVLPFLKDLRRYLRIRRM